MVRSSRARPGDAGADAAASRPGALSGLLAMSRPDPRLLQAIVCVLVALDVIACHAAGQAYAWEAPAAFGMLVLGGGMVAAVLVPWRRVPAAAFVVLPVLDVAALGLVRLHPHGGGVAIVAVVPAVWLAWQFGRLGAAAAFFAVAVLHTVPRVVYLGLDGAPVAGSLQLPLVVGAAALGTSLAVEALRARSREAEQRGRDAGTALAELGREQELNRTVLDTVDVGLLLLGPDGSYQSMNRALRALVDVSFPEGLPPVDRLEGVAAHVYAEDGVTRVPPDDFAMVRAMQGEEFEDRRIWVGADPERRRALSVSARTLRDADGAFAGAVLAFKDVTDLLGALRVKDEFVATVSHELRTPLTSIIGYVDLLLEGGTLDGTAQRQLSIVHRNGERLLHVVEDLLHTAQLAGGRSQLALKQSDLADLARDAVAAAEPAAHGAGVVLTATVPERLPVRVDAERVGQVLDNLLNNAVKYNRPGGSVTLALEQVGETVRLEVRDTGFGMLPDERDQLFTRFYRASHAADRAIPGAGLGLSITKAIVEAHEGSIEVESEVDVGTVVRVRLPLSSPVRDGDPPDQVDDQGDDRSDRHDDRADPEADPRPDDASTAVRSAQR